MKRPTCFLLAAILAAHSPPARAGEPQAHEADAAVIRGLEANKSGDMRRVLAAWKEALEAGERTGYKPASAMALGYLGHAYQALGKNTEALDSFSKARQLHHALGAVDNEVHDMAGMAIVRLTIGDVPEGLALLESAVKISISAKDKKAERFARRALASLYESLGRYAEAIQNEEASLAIARGLGDKGGIAESLHGLGIILAGAGDHQASLDRCQEALKELPSGEDRMRGQILNSIALRHMNMGEHDHALELFREALKLDPAFRRGIAINIGENFFLSGNLERAYQSFAQDYNPFGLARALLRWGRYREAKDILARKLPELEKRRGSGELLACYTGLGLAHEGLKEYSEAGKYYRLSHELIERMRAKLGDGQRLHFLGTHDWLFPRLEPYEGLVRIAPFLGEGEESSLRYAEFTRARQFMEAAARRHGGSEQRIPPPIAAEESSLLRRIAAAHARSDAAFSAKELSAFKRFQQELSGLEAEQDRFIEKLRKGFPAYAYVMYPRPADLSAIRLEADEWAIEYEVMERETKAFLVHAGRIAAARMIPASRAELAALVTKYRSSFDSIRRTADLAGFDPAAGKRLYDLLLEPLLSLVDSHGKPLVPKSAKLIIVPDEILGTLPFESLVVSHPERGSMPQGRFGPLPAGVRFVADDHDITYEQSLTALSARRALRKRMRPREELFVLADPIFDAADSRVRGTDLAKTAPPEFAPRLMGRLRPPSNLAESGDALAAPPRSTILPGWIPPTIEALVRRMGVAGSRGGLEPAKSAARDESALSRLDRTGVLASNLRDKVFAGARIDVLTGSSATESGLLLHDLGRYRYLLFATHGILDGAVPYIREPALVLSLLGNKPGHDGFLTLGEVMQMKINAETVALTACETGLGHAVNGEGVMGLGRAFQFAGARSVLVSLWSVAEDSTTMLAEAYFRHLKQGRSRREALKLARAEIRREGYGHPFYWAPFILVGD
jgi:tetratricopeptide (TPR) repeat protein